VGGLGSGLLGPATKSGPDYQTNFNDVYGVFLDATKASDRVRYDKLFDCLFDREVPMMFMRLLFTLYTNHSACVLWDGVYSKLMAKTQGFYKVVRASAVTHRKLQISKVVTPPIPD
jgi:hypothetical protein